MPNEKDKTMPNNTEISRRDWMRLTVASTAGLAIACLPESDFAISYGRNLALKPIPVILDTDIGDDIDDTWALVMLLKSPQFDLKLVTTTNGKAEYRAKLVAKILTAAGRTDVPVGLGSGGRDGEGGQASWVKDYNLGDYAGKVYEDGPNAMIHVVNELAGKPAPATIISIGPLTTMDEVLTKEPNVASRAKFVGMDGSVRKGYDNNPTPCVECNMTYLPGSHRVFTAPWRSMAITPLDTCGLVHLRGDLFKRLQNSKDNMVQVLLENYRIWSSKNSVADLTESSVLFDTVAVYLADPGPKPLIELEKLNIKVTDNGMTVIDPSGAPMNVASNWKDLEGYEKHLVDVLESPVVKRK